MARRKPQKDFAEWERADKEDYPILAYRVYESSLPVQGARRVSKPSKTAKKALTQMAYDVGDSDAANDENTINTNKHMAYKVRLPYTYETLSNRYECGRNVPDWFLADYMAYKQRFYGK